MNIAVVGTGYVGLVTGTCLAETGNKVLCIDIDEAKVKKMRSGHVPIYEPGLEEIFKRNINEGRLHFTTDLGTGIESADIIFLALPTPPGENGSADLSYIFAVADELGKLLSRYTIIIGKSTVPVGTAKQVKERIAKNAEVEFDVVSNPEFLREGFAVQDFLKPDRIIIGTSSKKAIRILEKLYKPYVREGKPIYFMDEMSSEMTKYAANSFLATKISFMNEVANLCELVGADVDAVRLGVGADERIGSRFLFPGIGYGGSCFPKDVLALENFATEHGYSFKILSAIRDVNQKQKEALVEKILHYYKNDIKGKTFALWGIAFKPDTDDIREAPALEIIKGLNDAGAIIKAYDPEALHNAAAYFGDNSQLTLIDNAYDSLKGADALVIATEWSEFRNPDFTRIASSLNKKVIFDGRNLYDLDLMEESGFHYESIGRKVVF